MPAARRWRSTGSPCSRDYLHSHGYPGAFEGHFNTGRIIGISPDGRTIVGHNGGPFGSINRYGFIVILPELDEQ
jgi:hypothetical protein